MDYDKKEFVAGKWADKAELYEKRIKSAKIVSETNPETSSFKNEDGTPQIQHVCKAQFPGYDEPLKIALNRATINCLVDDFGRSSKDWQGHDLTVEIDKLPGKKSPLYLIPEGYRRIEDENGYSVIVLEGEAISRTLRELIEGRATGYGLTSPSMISFPNKIEFDYQGWHCWYNPYTDCWGAILSRKGKRPVIIDGKQSKDDFVAAIDAY
jgi:hypothetical protein